MIWTNLVAALFGLDHDMCDEGDFLSGSAQFDGRTLAVIGTTNHAPIGYAMALRQARAVLDTMAAHPGRAILLLIDTQGQQLRRHDELLGIHRAMAHLGCCIDLARRRVSEELGEVGRLVSALAEQRDTLEAIMENTPETGLVYLDADNDLEAPMMANVTGTRCPMSWSTSTRLMKL